MIAIFGMMNTLRSTRKIQTQVFLYSEAQAAMDYLARYIEQNGIDYEAYYDREAKGNDSDWHTENYGYYGQSFFHTGDDGGPTSGGPYSGINGYDAECPSDSSLVYPDDCPDELPIYDELDYDTGAHPFSYIDTISSSYTDDPSYMNAFCESSSGSVDCEDFDYFFTDDLILISPEGDERTIFTREDFNENSGEYRLSIMQLTGSDSTLDGIVDDWECLDGYTCNDSFTGDGGDTLDIPWNDDLNYHEGTRQEDFMAITPTAVTIESFYVLIAPLEDPYRAFAEEDVQIQPHVTIIMTMSLSEEYSQNLLGNVPSITVQRSISTGVYTDVNSYE
jgi:hypothetical protein